MSFFSAFLRLAEWALQAVFIPRVLVVCVLALASLTVAAIETETVREAALEADLPLAGVLTHLLFFPAAIAAGIIWANPIANPTVPHRAIEAGRRCLDVLMYASFCIVCLVDLADARFSLVRREHHAVGRSACILRSIYIGNVNWWRLALTGIAG